MEMEEPLALALTYESPVSLVLSSGSELDVSTNHKAAASG